MIIKWIIACLLILPPSLGASELLLLGFNAKRAPSIDKTFEKMMREELVIIPGIALVDIEKTRQLNHHLNFPENDLISETQLETLRKYLNDSLYIAWGTLHELVIEPKRKQFVKAQFSGRLKVDLHIYNYMKKRITYAGTLEAAVEEDRGMIFLSPVKTAYHIGAAEYTIIMEKAMSEAVRLCRRVITATILSDNAKAEQERLLEQNSEAPLQDSTKNDSISATYDANGTIPPDSIRNKVVPTGVDTGITKQKNDTAGVPEQTNTP